MCPLENKIGCIPDLEKEYFVFFFQMVNFPLKRKQNKKRPNFNYRKGVPKKKYHKFTSIENGRVGGGHFRFQKCFLLRIKKKH